jgi:hypothetical protein
MDINKQFTVVVRETNTYTKELYCNYYDINDKGVVLYTIEDNDTNWSSYVPIESLVYIKKNSLR